MEQKQSSLILTIKAEQNQNMVVEGYASIFNIEDNIGDVILPGAFKEAILKRKIVLLWQHDNTKPIGVINEIYEDQKGLFIKATINSKVKYGKEAEALIHQGAINSFSIGFYTKDFYISQNSNRYIKNADLWEVSLVTFPCNQEAIITNIEHKVSKANLHQPMEEKMHNHSNNNFDIDTERFIKVEKSLENIETILSRPNLSFNPVEDKKFHNFLKTGIVEMDHKSFNTLSGDEGGFLLQPELSKKILAGIQAKSPMRQLASLESISTNSLDILIENGDFQSNWVADGAARNDTDNPKIIQKKIPVHELYAQPKATQRLLDDSAVNLENWIIERLEDSFARIENHSFINGDGANKPKGILSYDASTIHRVSSDTEGDITLGDIHNLINSLDEYYLPNSSLLMHRTTLSHIQSIKDSTGRFVWQASIADAAPGTIFGIPVICSADMPCYAKGNLAIILADFKAGYKIVDRIGINTLRDQYTEKPFVKFYTVKRVGGDVVDNKAIKILKM